MLRVLCLLLVCTACAVAFRAEINAGDTPALLDPSRLTTVSSQPGSTSSVIFSSSASDIQTAAANIVGLPGPTSLLLTKDTTDELGQRHVRFQQVQPFDGGVAKVVGGDFIVHLDRVSNGVYAVTGTVVQGVNVPLPPKVSRVAAAATAGKETRQRVPDKAAVNWESVFARDLELQVVPSSGGDVVVWCGNADHTDSAVPGLLRVCVNGHGAGQVKESRNVLTTAATTGTGYTLLKGTVVVNTNQVSATSYELRDLTRGSTYTTDLAGKTSGTGKIFVDADNTWGSLTTANTQTAAVDAHFGVQMTWDYYLNEHNRSGIFGTGAGSYSRVHYGRKYINAFWNGVSMTYGDGDGVTYRPLVSLDVAGHEMTHGVTERTAGLTYSGESGGLNEAMSDIFGTMVECYANVAYDPCDYMIGEQIYINQPGSKALRYMYQPSLDGRSPNCWSSSIGTLDVHYSSGPFNHWFWLLAVGGQSKCNQTISLPAVADAALGRRVAARIVYRALTTYMTSSTNYSGAKVATLSAARDLYGDTSAEYARVVDAWKGINVP